MHFVLKKKKKKEWTQSINLGIDDDPKIVQIGNTFIYIYIYIYKMIGGFEPHIWNITNDIITIKLSLKPKIIYIYIYIY